MINQLPVRPVSIDKVLSEVEAEKLLPCFHIFYL